MSADTPSLPPKRASMRGVKEFETLTLQLQTTTPVLGGGSKAQEIDEHDPIRGPAIRGELRFWWRALYGRRWKTFGELAEEESKRWGGTRGAHGKRSLIEVVIFDVAGAEKDTESLGFDDPRLYAVWPVLSTKAARCRPGLRFTLQVRVGAQWQAEVEHSIQAWLLFGGYGGRTRRGCGSLTVLSERERWLPRSANPAAIRQLLDDSARELFGDVPETTLPDMPQLQGAKLHWGDERQFAMEAWKQALRWLRDFRQGIPQTSQENPNKFARLLKKDDGAPRTRRSGRPQVRPGQSNWPEADKVRRYANPDDRPQKWAHEPRREQHDRSPAWPRAGFGLPILFQFAPKDRDREPKGYKLYWDERADGRDPHDRLASPLIVKAMPLANGRFVPVALWLTRTYPKGYIVLVNSREHVIQEASAEFDRLKAGDDHPLFDPLRNATSLREAFFQWLPSQRK